ncbi:hypothetical protein Bpla01_48950 [Burkholderia plantarii]|nr:hypothetical protein Bpla01_48950 [Burkholderia plantarii]
MFSKHRGEIRNGKDDKREKSSGQGLRRADRQGHEGQICFFRQVSVRRVARWQETHRGRHREGCAGADGSRITSCREIRIACGGKAAGETDQCE